MATVDTARSYGSVLEQLSAVHSLLASDRQAEQHDILVATSMEALASGPRTTTELVHFVESTWPGVALAAQQARQALNVALAAGLVEKIGTGPNCSWTLTALGVADLATSRKWASDVVRLTRRGLWERARDHQLDASDEDIAEWTSVLSEALIRGIGEAHSVYEGAVELLAQKTLIPTSYEMDTMFEVISRRSPNEEVEGFLTAAVMAAMDPNDAFGSDLVSNVSTGYMLHAILANRDLIGARKTLGSLSGERALLDTPTLFLLLGSDERSDAMELAICAALRAGIEVVLLDHIVDEMTDVLGRLEETAVPSLVASLKDGVSPRVLAEVVAEEVLEMWLSGMARSEYSDWDEFREMAESLPGRLRDLGVSRRPSFNNDETSSVLACGDALRAQLAKRDRGRGEVQIERDAHTMTVAWRTRRRQRYEVGYSGRFWPGAIVVTTDQVMSPAYSSLDTKDAFPLAVTPSQWLGLISSCCDPAAIGELASSAALLLTQQSRSSIASRYPADVAAEMARTLSPECGVSDTDLRLAQLSCADILQDQLDFVEDPLGSATKMASAVLAKRGLRLVAHHERMAAEVEQADASRREAQRRADRQRELLLEAERRLEERDSYITILRENTPAPREISLNDMAEDADGPPKSSKWSVVLLTIGVGILLVAAWFHLSWLALGTLLAGAAVWSSLAEARETGKASQSRLLLAGVLQAGGLLMDLAAFL